MKYLLFFSFFSILFFAAFAQDTDAEISQKKTVNALIAEKGFIIEKNNAATAVKNQANTGTCWSFSTTALLESQLLKSSGINYDLSEMFTVRNIYIEKAKNYILRQGHTQFGEGGLGHDLIRAIAKYGAMPESVYSGLKSGEQYLNHTQLVNDAKSYLDSILKAGAKLKATGAIPANWMEGFMRLLNDNLGVAPETFVFNNKSYTPLSFAKEVMNFKEADYVNITSFTHQPFYQPFVLQVPDNFSNGTYYNIPLDEMMGLVKTGLQNGFTFMWDADISNAGFMQKNGIAITADSVTMAGGKITADTKEINWNAGLRQQLYENLTTQDDHLMQVTGIEKSKGGKSFFIVKNSWGKVGPFNGYIQVSETYFAINTINLVVPKAALSNTLLDKLKLN